MRYVILDKAYRAPRKMSMKAKKTSSKKPKEDGGKSKSGGGSSIGIGQSW